MASLENSVVKIEDLCRTCLAKENELFSVFDVYLDEIALHSIITAITEIKIEADDGLPTTICHDCKEKAVTAFQFKSKSQQADTTLRNLFTKANEYSTEVPYILEEVPVDVKTEKYPCDAADDYLDLDFTLGLPEDNETYNDIEAVKKEDDEQCNSYMLDLESEDKPVENNTNKCIMVEYKENGTYCPLCGTCYEDSEELTKHVWEAHAELMGPKKRGRPKKMVTSTILNKLSENGYYLKYIADKKHNCIFCKEETKTKEELVVHMMEHKDVKVLRCLLCKKMYLTRKDFDQHACIGSQADTHKLQKRKQSGDSIEEVRNKVLNFPTEVLLQELLTRNDYAEDGSCVEVCGACGGVFPSAAHLASHRDADHPELSLRCHICHKVFASTKSAARHRQACAAVERKYACSTCGQRFAYEISLNKHILRSHRGQSVSVRFMDAQHRKDDRQYQCDHCHRRFYRKDLLARHVKIHKPGEKYFECEVCHKKFPRRDNLRSHMRVHVNNRTNSEASGPNADSREVNACLCLYCGRRFANSSNLIVHMRRHTGEKPYKCDFCEKGFPRSSDLQCHRRSHTGEKPCICGICGKGFSRSNKLSRHMRVHTGAKPYKCPYCEKGFSQSNDLTLHVRRHTGDKPYVCDLCGDRFIQGTALHNHRRAHGHYPASAHHSHTVAYTVQTH